MQPAASAGPILRVAIAAGKFHGVTSTADPDGLARPPGSGWRRPARCEIAALGTRTASSANQRKNSAAYADLALRVGQGLAVLER